ncbi:MAG: hypothetical protein U0531_14570 [Dehalococcoidia bacterium]
MAAMVVPCRLTVFLARSAPVAVVLRRGPSDWARLSLWRTDDDRIEHGQWFHGRVYERRCDVSDDGSLFVYFARQSRAGTPPARESWVAVSRPPWFTALALWSVGTTYCLGGYFPTPRALWTAFSDPPDQGVLPRGLRTVTGPPPFIDRTTESTNRTVFMNRLMRDGWTAAPDAPADTWRRPSPDAPDVGGDLDRLGPRPALRPLCRGRRPGTRARRPDAAGARYLDGLGPARQARARP